MAEIELFIDNNGDIHAIHNDFVDGLDLGDKEVTRASNVEFDNGEQRWYADISPELFGGTLRVWGDTRKEILEIESKIVTKLIEERICRDDQKIT